MDIMERVMKIFLHRNLIIVSRRIVIKCRGMKRARRYYRGRGLNFQKLYCLSRAHCAPFIYYRSPIDTEVLIKHVARKLHNKTRGKF